MSSGRAGSTKPPGGGAEAPGVGVLTPNDRERVLRALSECCAENGYEAASVPQVAERAGVPLATFESLFSGKEGCAIAALNKLASEVLTTTATASGADQRERTLVGLRAAVGLLAKRHPFTYLGCIESRQGGTERLHRTYEANLQMLSVMLGRVHPQDAALPPRAARAALGGAEALIRREVAAGRTRRLPQLLPTLVYGAMAPLLGQKEALRVARASAAEPAADGP